MSCSEHLRRPHDAPGAPWGLQWVPNGTGATLFMTPLKLLTEWSATGDGSGENLQWLCSRGNFAPNYTLSAGDQRVSLANWILHLFLPT